ncbi:MAG TPA: hypothetical protein PKW95_15685 [bacterium]|nr:hypothetical protein [bacterium]
MKKLVVPVILCLILFALLLNCEKENPKENGVLEDFELPHGAELGLKFWEAIGEEDASKKVDRTSFGYKEYPDLNKKENDKRTYRLKEEDKANNQKMRVVFTAWGNANFYSGEYLTAIKYYNKALAACDPARDAILIKILDDNIAKANQGLKKPWKKGLPKEFTIEMGNVSKLYEKDDEITLFSSAILNKNQGEAAEILTKLEKDLTVESAEISEQLGILYFYRGDAYVDAANQFSKCIDIYVALYGCPPPHMLKNLSYALQLSGNLELAAATLEEYLKKIHDQDLTERAIVEFKLGAILAGLGRMDQASECINKGLAYSKSLSAAGSDKNVFGKSLIYIELKKGPKRSPDSPIVEVQQKNYARDYGEISRDFTIKANLMPKQEKEKTKNPIEDSTKDISEKSQQRKKGLDQPVLEPIQFNKYK